MCNPVVAAAAIVADVGMKIGGAIVEHKAQNKAAAENEKLALESLRLQDHELSLEEVQTRLAGRQQEVQGEQATQAAEGDISQSAAARGVGGVSIDLLLQDAQAQGARFKTGVQRQTDAEAEAITRQKDTALEEAKARIAGVPKASGLATGLKIGGAAADAASYYIKRRNGAK